MCPKMKFPPLCGGIRVDENACCMTCPTSWEWLFRVIFLKTKKVLVFVPEIDFSQGKYLAETFL